MTTVGRPALAQPARGGGDIGQPSQDSPPDETERPTPYYWVGQKLRNRYPDADWPAVTSFIRADWEAGTVLSVMQNRVLRHFGLEIAVDTVRMMAYAASDYRRSQGRQRLAHVRSESSQCDELDRALQQEIDAAEAARLALRRRCDCGGIIDPSVPHQCGRTA